MTIRAVFLLLISVVASILYTTPVTAREKYPLIPLPQNAGSFSIEMNSAMQLYDQQIISVYTTLDTHLSPGAGATVELRAIGNGLLVRNIKGQTIGIAGPGSLSRTASDWEIKALKPEEQAFLIQIRGPFGEVEKRYSVSVHAVGFDLWRYQTADWIAQHMISLSLAAILLPLLGLFITRRRSHELRFKVAVASLVVVLVPFIAAFILGVTLPPYAVVISGAVGSGILFEFLLRHLVAPKAPELTDVSHSMDADGNESDPMRLLQYAVRRSSALGAYALRRASIHMAFGITIGSIGLLFFFLTTSELFGSAKIANWPALAITLASALPRTAVLIFVEITAGFFLKQYAAALEEHRYFERVLRSREAELASYVIRVEATPPWPDAISHFADHLLIDSGVGVLKSGETTSTLEAQRAIPNDLRIVVDRAILAAKEAVVSLKDKSSTVKET